MNFIEHVFGGRKGLKAHTKTLGKTYPFSFQLSLASLVVLWGSTRIRISGRMSGWERVLFVLCIHFFIPCPLLKNHRVILWFGLRIPCPLSGFVVIYLIGKWWRSPIFFLCLRDAVLWREEGFRVWSPNPSQGFSCKSLFKCCWIPPSLESFMGFGELRFLRKYFLYFTSNWL